MTFNNVVRQISRTERKAGNKDRMVTGTGEPVVLSNHSTKTHQSVYKNHTQNNFAEAGKAIKPFYMPYPPKVK